MKADAVVVGLGALAQKSRLAVFRHLVQEGPSGSCPGEIAQVLGVSASTLSFHLKALSHAGLVTAEHNGRSITYRVDFEAMQGLVDYLTENCCGGNAGLCPPRCVPAVSGKAAGAASRTNSQSTRKPAPAPAKVAGRHPHAGKSPASSTSRTQARKRPSR